MTITSLAFALFTAITIIVYYLPPIRKHQWVVLLAASCFFYIYNSFQYSFFILTTTVSVYFAACQLKKMKASARAMLKEHKAEWDRTQKKAFKQSRATKEKRLLVLLLLLNFGILFFLKYYNFMAGGLMDLIFGPSVHLPTIDLLLPLGISFYTFQAMGYLIDVYRETIEPETSFPRFALFVSFFPQIIQGPISTFDQLGAQLTAEHRVEWRRFKTGMELILWGLFKKLIIADRAINAVNTISNDYTIYSGEMILFSALLYALQLYADFSGGIDIVRGVGCILGIDMEINFRQPYFSRSLSEYWRRWHITLGAWMKKYVFYSLAVSDSFIRLGKTIGETRLGETAAGKHLSKTLPAAIASFVVFLLIGIWHGANSRYIGFGIWNGSIIMLAILLEPLFQSWIRILHIRTEAWLWKLFQMVRTFVLILVGYYFDIAPNFIGALDMMKRSLLDCSFQGILTQIHDVGLSTADCAVLIYGLAVVSIFSIRLERTGLDTPGELLDRHHFILQWIVLLWGIVSILLFGIYGPGYDPADFIYMGF